MKPLVVSFLIILAFIIGYTYGQQIGQQTGNATAASYSKLYNQAITWQNHVIAALPTIQPNPKLKEKS